MSNSFIIISIPIIALIISFVSTKGTLSNLKYKRQWWKIITIRGWIVMGLTFLIAGLLYCQNSKNEKREAVKDQELQKQRNDSDSIISSRVKSNRDTLFSDLSEAFAKQNLAFDTSNNTINEITKGIRSNTEATLDDLKAISNTNNEILSFSQSQLDPITPMDIHLNYSFRISKEYFFNNITYFKKEKITEKPFLNISLEDLSKMNQTDSKFFDRFSSIIFEDKLQKNRKDLQLEDRKFILFDISNSSTTSFQTTIYQENDSFIINTSRIIENIKILNLDYVNILSIKELLNWYFFIELNNEITMNNPKVNIYIFTGEKKKIRLYLEPINYNRTQNSLTFFKKIEKKDFRRHYEGP